MDPLLLSGSISLTFAFTLVFVYIFLDKWHTRHIGPADFSRHRHAENLRRKRKEVVESSTTMEILKVHPEDKHHMHIHLEEDAEWRAQYSEKLRKSMLG